MFEYQLVMGDGPDTVTSILAYRARTRSGLRGLLWSVPDRRWISAPAVVSDLLEEPALTTATDRLSAERVARDQLGTELPDEQELISLSDEGERSGLRFGPPSAG